MTATREAIDMATVAASAAASKLANDVVVMNPSRSPHLRSHLFRRAVPKAEVKVGTDGQVPMMGELSSGFLVPLVPPRPVVNQDDPGEGARAEGA